MKYVRVCMVVAVVLCAVGFVPQSAAAVYPTIYADGVLAHTNAQRYYEGLPMLESNIELSRIAAQKMQDLFARQYFAHESPSGEDVADLARNAGYAYLAIGENLALGDFTSSKDVVEAWMDSPGHRENILAEKYSEIGIAAGRSMYDGRKTWVVVQVFGLPQTSCPAPDASLKREMDKLSDTIALLEIIAHMREALVEDASPRSSEHRERVASYNLAAEIYNEYVAEYRTLVADYNHSIDTHNECLADKTS